MAAPVASGAYAASRSISKQLAGVHDAGGVKRLLDRTHRAQCHRRGIALQFLALQAADAVLGTDAAGELCHQVVNRAPDLRFLRQERRGSFPLDAIDVEMQVAVASVSVAHQYAIVD